MQAQSNPVLSFDIPSEHIDPKIVRDKLGRITVVEHNAIRTRLLTEAELFFHQITDRDSMITYVELVARDEYFWGFENELEYIRRWERQRGRVNVFGRDHELTIGRLDHDRQGRVGEIQRVGYTLTNRGQHNVSLGFLDLPTHIHAEKEKWELAPGDTLEITLKVVIQPGEEKVQIRLHHVSGSIPLGLTTYGYHVRSDDLMNEAGLICPRSLHYYRTGNETLLELADPVKGEVLIRYFVHGDRTFIDLSAYSLSELEFCAREYVENTVSCSAISVE